MTKAIATIRSGTSRFVQKVITTSEHVAYPEASDGEDSRSTCGNSARIDTTGFAGRRPPAGGPIPRR